MYQELITFWFSDEASKYWFNSTREFDLLLTGKFEKAWQRAVRGELDYWGSNADGSLALVILLDQCPLNMYRGQALSFSSEAQSRDVARAAIDKGFDRELAVERKAFLYLPFMHSENIDDQTLSLKLFDQPGLEDNLKFARHHYGIVERFGRFPHRNATLGRDSTEDELNYLNSKAAFLG